MKLVIVLNVTLLRNRDSITAESVANAYNEWIIIALGSEIVWES